MSASGQIESSLFMAGHGCRAADATTMQLAEVFRWDIDFVLDLRDGDSFKLVYEQLLREGVVVGDGDSPGGGVRE